MGAVNRSGRVKKLSQEEDYVRQAMEQELGVALSKRNKRIGLYDREVDLISEDESIAVQIKGGRDLKPNGRIQDYRLAEISFDCLTLKALKATKKFLVLTDEMMYQQFRREIEGYPLEDIEIRYIHCP